MRAHTHTHTHTLIRMVDISCVTLQVDLKADALSFIAAEVNVRTRSLRTQIVQYNIVFCWSLQKLLQLENNDVNISQLKTATEKYASHTISN